MSHFNTPIEERYDALGKGQTALGKGIHLYRYELVKRFAFGRLLDAGCGCGYSAKCLMGKVDYTGIDVDPVVIEYARKHYNDFGHFETYDGHGFPFPDQSFDTVSSIEVIEHMELDEQRKFLFEVQRVLKPSGLFIVSTPNRRFLIKLVKKHLIGSTNPYHKYEHTTRGFLRFLHEHGLTIEHRFYIGEPVCIGLIRLARCLLNRFPNVHQYAIRCGLQAGFLTPHVCIGIAVVGSFQPRSENNDRFES